ncbi:MAG: hypothetical protein ACKVX7_06260 [Planctomycetota bacterium]
MNTPALENALDGNWSAPGMHKGRLLRGANVHHRTTVFAQPLDPGGLFGRSSRDASADFAARFVARFDGLAPSLPDGCLTAAARASLTGSPDLPLVEALLAAIVAVERCVASAMNQIDEPRFSCVVPRDRGLELVWETHSRAIARAAARTGLAGLMELLPTALVGEGVAGEDFATLFAALMKRSRRRQWSATTALLAHAARRRGVPCEVLAGNYLRLGEGVLQHLVSESSLGVAGTDGPLSIAQGEAILDRVLPAGVEWRVPTALVVGQRGARTVLRTLDRLLRASYRGVGVATRKQTTIQGEPIDRTSQGRRGGPKFLLSDPRVDMVLTAASPRRIVERGLQLDSFNVIALLDPGRDTDLEIYLAGGEIARAATTGVVVIGTENPHCEFILDAGGEAHVVIASRRANHPLAERHAAAGGTVVHLEAGPHSDAIAVRQGADIVASIPVASLRKRKGRPKGAELRNVLITAGLAFALGAQPSVVVSKFTPDG